MRTPTVTRKPIIIIQGGQYGSEAKGLITAKVCGDRRVDLAIRTGTVNAGHTVYYKGQAYAMQQLPVAWVHPDCIMVLGPGAFIHPPILEREVRWIADAMYGGDVAPVWKRLFIDHRCGIHRETHTHRATARNRHHSIGTTGKGCSEAVIDKVMQRDQLTPPLFSNHHPDIPVWDTVTMVNNAYDQGKQILIEGTQGTLLDLHLGPYPYTTHKQTQAASWMAEAGLSCALPVDLVLVMRTYPIRVAGNSGPLPQELSWTQLAGHINQRLRSRGKDERIRTESIRAWENAVRAIAGPDGDPAHWSPELRQREAKAASEIHKMAWGQLGERDQMELRKLFEMTTVTKKLRRIALWNDEKAAESIMLNRPTSVALTFLNYIFPEAWGANRHSFGKLDREYRTRIYTHVGMLEDRLGVKVSYVSFGPLEENTFRLYEDEAGSDLVATGAAAEAGR